MSKKTYIILFIIFCTSINAQKNCDFSENISDTLGTFRSTKEFLAFERIFGQNEQYLYLNLNNADGTPYLTVQYIQKNNQFIKAQCFDSGSKIFLQLENGKVFTLLHTNEESCGNYVAQPEGKNVRVLVGNFFFLKNNIEDLKKSPVTMMRVKFGVESTDFVIRDELDSESLKRFYRPSTYFMDYLHCVLD